MTLPFRSTAFPPLHRLLLAAGLVLILAPAWAAAELRFDETEQTLPAEVGQEEVVAEFRFTNTGDQAVTINRTQSSCGCTVAQLARKVYAPGESGTIRAVFSIGGRTGKQVKTIAVFTSERPDDPHLLRLETDIPKVYEVSPRIVYWMRDEEPEPKRIEITFNPDSPANITGVTEAGARADFDYTIETLEPGLRYRMEVWPTSTAERTRAVYRLQTDSKAASARELTTFAYVR